MDKNAAPLTWQIGVNVVKLSGSANRWDKGRKTLTQVMRSDFCGSKDPIIVLFIILWYIRELAWFLRFVLFSSFLSDTSVSMPSSNGQRATFYLYWPWWITYFWYLLLYLKKIRFCYPGTLEELLQQVAGLHESSSTSPTPPSLIVVDRLEAYLCGPGGSRQAGFRMDHLSRAAHLSALLCDTAVFLRRGSSSSSPCQVIASYQPEDDSGQAGGQTHTSCSVLHVLDRFFQARCTLTRDESYEAEAAGLQEIWHIYVSLDFNGERCEDRKGDDQEWQLLVAPGGVMEFQMVWLCMITKRDSSNVYLLMSHCGEKSHSKINTRCVQNTIANPP